METQVLGLEITELRLGLPGVSVLESVAGAGGKKEVMTTKEEKKLKKKKRVFAEMMMSGTGDAEDENSSSNENSTTKSTRVVGWPPVCSYRQKNSTTTTTHALAAEKKKINNGAAGGEKATKFYVKVSMDGAPYLRKVDLGAHKGYSDLSAGLKQLFGCFGIGGSLAGEDQSDYSEYVTVYEDREGDWMLVGDVPWKMFTDSCKRLRIMKSSEAKGFQLQLKSSPAGVEQRSSNRQHC